MRGERIAAPIFALLIVLSGAGGAIAPGASPIGTVDAQSADTDECSTWDSILYDITTIGNLNTEDENPCSAEYQRQQLADEWNETDAKQTRTQIHSQAGQLAAGNEQFLTVEQNLLTDSNTIAFSKGEAAAVEVLSNGGTVSEAQQAANDSIRRYYKIKQQNMLDRWNVNVETIRTLNQRAVNTTGVSNDFITVSSKDGFNGTDASSSDVRRMIETTDQTRNVTLLNGYETTIQLIGTNSEVSDLTHTWFASNPGSPDPSYDIEGVGWYTKYSVAGETKLGGYGTTVEVRPTSNLSSKVVLDYTEFYQQWDRIQNKSESTQKEVSVYINQSLAPAVENNELNATSYVSPATLAQEYAQEYGNGTSYIRATAIAAYSGFDAPDLEDTGSMTITYNGTTYEGLLLSQEAPSGGWQSGETYDPALLSGLQMFAVAGENSSVVELDGPFTVESITGTDGEQIQTATTFNVTYETSNASANYTELQQEIRSLNKQIEERQAQATSGGTGGDSGTNPLDALAAFLGVSAGAAVVVLIGAAAIVAKVYSPR